MAQMDEVFPGVFISNAHGSQNRESLIFSGITHVLNVAGSRVPCSFPQDFVYKSLQLLDTPSQNIMQFFPETSTFMRECKVRGGKVLVHCVEAGMKLEEAYRRVKGVRPICQPNEGFWIQLQHYENTIKSCRTLPQGLAFNSTRNESQRDIQRRPSAQNQRNSQLSRDPAQAQIYSQQRERGQRQEFAKYLNNAEGSSQQVNSISNTNGAQHTNATKSGSAGVTSPFKSQPPPQNNRVAKPEQLLDMLLKSAEVSEPSQGQLGEVKCLKFSAPGKPDIFAKELTC